MTITMYLLYQNDIIILFLQLVYNISQFNCYAPSKPRFVPSLDAPIKTHFQFIQNTRIAPTDIAYIIILGGY